MSLNILMLNSFVKMWGKFTQTVIMLTTVESYSILIMSSMHRSLLNVFMITSKNFDKLNRVSLLVDCNNALNFKMFDLNKNTFLKTSFFRDQGTFKRASNGNHHWDHSYGICYIFYLHVVHYSSILSWLVVCGLLFKILIKVGIFI